MEYTMESWDSLNLHSGRLSLDSDDENIDEVRHVGSFSVGLNPMAQYGIAVPQKGPGNVTNLPTSLDNKGNSSKKVLAVPSNSSVNKGKSLNDKIEAKKVEKRRRIRKERTKMKAGLSTLNTSVYDTWPIHKLKYELRQRNLSTLGKRDTLIAKLVYTDKKSKHHDVPRDTADTQHEKNVSKDTSNTQIDNTEMLEAVALDQHGNTMHTQNENNDITEDAEDTSYILPEPQEKHYLDITSESHVPFLSEDDLNHFATLVEREDKLKAAQMYTDGYLLTCRLAYEPNKNSYYINAVCSSENKRLAYRITIKLVDHIILEAECECADTGPSAQCKHVIVVIYGIIDFTNTRTINASLSFTKFNPVKSEHLILKANDTNLRNIAKFDPRPAKRQSKDEYVNYFKNLVANYCITNNCNMPILQIVKTSYVNVLKDHDYSEKTITDDMKLCEETGLLE